jgi:orotate phosphoribosyltransferase
MKAKIEVAGYDHLKTLKNCDGFYSCPKAPDGTRRGHLVAYAGEYELPNGSRKKFVGDVYANFAKAEVHPNVLSFFARELAAKLNALIKLEVVDVFCGAPIGGYSLADALSLATNVDVIKAEKKTIALSTPTSKEKSKLIFGRHNVKTGEGVVIVEDVCNNFSTTEELISLIDFYGGEVLAVACFLNRSLTVNDKYYSTSISRSIPIISLVRLPIDEWKQEDCMVAEDVAKGNVAWDPKKKDWDRLMQEMG